MGAGRPIRSLRLESSEEKGGGGGNQPSENSSHHPLMKTSRQKTWPLYNAMMMHRKLSEAIFHRCNSVEVVREICLR